MNWMQPWQLEQTNKTNKHAYKQAYKKILETCTSVIGDKLSSTFEQQSEYKHKLASPPSETHIAY